MLATLGIAYCPAVAVVAQADVKAQSLAAPRVSKLAGDAARRLERLKWMIEQKAWDEACDLVDELLGVDHDGWVEAADGLFIGLDEAVQRHFAALPADGLAKYRSRVDSLADDWLTRGIATRDAALLRRVADQLFFSSRGDDALWALGDLALHEGNYQAARSAWQRVRPETAPEGDVAFPDSSIALSDVRARLALVSICAGELTRADLELEQIRETHPEASGRLAGRDGNYAELLTQLLQEARKAAPLRAADPTEAEYVRAWSVEIESPSDVADSSSIILQPQRDVYPAACDGLVLYQDAAGVHALRLATGEPGPAKGGPLFAAPSGSGGSPPYWLAANQRRVFGAFPPGDRAPAQIIGLDLARDGALFWQRQADTLTDSFVGTPVAQGPRVLASVESGGSGSRLSVVCYDLWTPEHLWRRSLGSVNEPSPGGADASGPSMVIDGGVLYINTNLGMVAALRADDGQPIWLRTYPRSSCDNPTGLYHRLNDSRPSPCFVANSIVVTAPQDSEEIFALDAATGAKLWARPLPAADAYILVVEESRILLSGERMWTLDLATGEGLDDRDANFADLQGGAGQGTIDEGVLYWPTDDNIQQLDLHSGKPRGAPLALPTGGANILVVITPADKKQYIVAASQSHITAYGRASDASATVTQESNQE